MPCGLAARAAEEIVSSPGRSATAQGRTWLKEALSKGLNDRRMRSIYLHNIYAVLNFFIV